MRDLKLHQLHPEPRSFTTKLNSKISLISATQGVSGIEENFKYICKSISEGLLQKIQKVDRIV